ncbi:uncharacterized protein G2W53_026176 [Senna tora]|uniref:Uncharacterized protein n=1 Tax=Senna tora TaxID=362788 RepID=A0A834TGH5_9FABA|nr:uncharacterized protein G2W53_026176 [Senna tora]
MEEEDEDDAELVLMGVSKMEMQISLMSGVRLWWVEDPFSFDFEIGE